MSLSEFAEKYHISDEIIHDIEEAQSGTIQIGGRYFNFEEGNKKSITFVQVKFEHLLNGKTVNFNMENESDGTQRMVDLLPILFKLKSNEHSIYIVDELDRSLHTKLSKYLINKFIQFGYKFRNCWIITDNSLIYWSLVHLIFLILTISRYYSVLFL